KPIAPVQRAVTSTTRKRQITALATQGTCKKLSLRFRMYWITEMVRLSHVRTIQINGLPGRKKATTEKFQEVINQAWCQRSSSGRINRNNNRPMTMEVVGSKSGQAAPEVPVAIT